VIGTIVIVLLVGGLAILTRIWLMHEEWKQLIDHADKVGLYPLPGESLTSFRRRVRRELPASSKIPVDDDDPVATVVKLTYAVNEVVNNGVMVLVSATPEKVIFQLKGKRVLIEDLVAVRKVADRLVPEGVEIVVLPVFAKSEEEP
jgi:hypothetical protein